MSLPNKHFNGNTVATDLVRENVPYPTTEQIDRARDIDTTRQKLARLFQIRDTLPDQIKKADTAGYMNDINVAVCSIKVEAGMTYFDCKPETICEAAGIKTGSWYTTLSNKGEVPGKWFRFYINERIAELSSSYDKLVYIPAIESVVADIASLKTEVYDLKNRVGELESDNKSQQAQIDALTTKFNF